MIAANEASPSSQMGLQSEGSVLGALGHFPAGSHPGFAMRALVKSQPLSSGCPGLSNIFPGPKVFVEMMEIGMISTKLFQLLAARCFLQELGQILPGLGTLSDRKIDAPQQISTKGPVNPQEEPALLGWEFWAAPSQLLQDISTSVVFHKSSFQAPAPTSHLSPALPPPATPICSCSLDF